MKQEARQVLSIVGAKQRAKFIDDAIVSHSQSSLPSSVREELLLKENKRLNMEASAREAYIVELEETIKELKSTRNYKVQQYISPSETPLPPDKEESLRIRTDERVKELTKSNGTLNKKVSKLKKERNELIGVLCRNNLTIPSIINQNEEENR